MSEGGGAYDASEVDERPRSSHLSRKDVRVLGIVLLVLVILLIPVYSLLRMQRDRHICKQNLGHISKAVSIYAIENNDRYPPAFVTNSSGEPQLFDRNGAESETGQYIYSWLSLVQQHLNPRANYECPSAEDEEGAANLNFDPKKDPFQSFYGWYVPWSAYVGQMVTNPDRSILFGETANHGANGTYDPTPFSHGIDGIVIGWDKGNLKPVPGSEHVSRLAFPETKSGTFSKAGAARHADGSLFISVSGALVPLKPDAARIQYIDSARTEMTGRWATR